MSQPHLDNGALRLRIVEPDSREPREVDVSDGLVLGRSSSAGAILSDPYASGKHLQFARRAGRFVVEHIGGKNGTQIVDGPLLERGQTYEVEPGVRIALGGTRIEVVAAGLMGATTVIGAVGPNAENRFETTIMQRCRSLEPLAIRAMLETANPRLVFSSDALSEIVQIQDVEFTIGRGPNGGLSRVIDDTTISGTHARISFDGDRFFLWDLGSTNHTYVFCRDRKEQLAAGEPRELTPDARIVFGSVEAMFVLDYDAEAQAVDRSRNADTVRFLKARRCVSDYQANLARRAASEEHRHIGEILIRDRIVTIESWLEAVERAQSDEVVKRSVSGVTVAVCTLGLVASGLLVAVMYFMFK